MNTFEYGLEYKPKGQIRVTQNSGQVLAEHIFTVKETTVDLENVVQDDVDDKGVVEYSRTVVGYSDEKDEIRHDAPEEVFTFLEQNGFRVQRA